MKLNNKTKSVITAAIASLIIDMWRDWPWLKALFCKINDAHNKINE